MPLKKINKTAKERKEKEGEAKRAAGLVRKEIWIKPELWPLVVDFVDKIHKDTANA